MYYITWVNPKIVSDAFNSALNIRVTDELKDWLCEMYPARGELSAYVRGLIESEKATALSTPAVLTEKLRRVRGESGEKENSLDSEQRRSYIPQG